MSELVPIEEAQQIILNAVQTLPSETIALEDALGRTLAADTTSDIDIVPFDNSAMDGFAFRAQDTQSATDQTPAQLEIVAYIPAGAYCEQTIQPGQAARIMTGAAMPAGADTVEKIEKVSFTGDGMLSETLILDHAVSQGNNVRYRGEEAKAGSLVLPAGTTLDPAALGLLASTGNVEVSVYQQPVVGIISLGSELVEATDVPDPGKIRNSNRYALIGCVQRAGAQAKTYPIVPDDYDSIKDTLAQAIRECDFVVSSGGAGGGDFDFITQVAAELGQVFFKYVNMRPGKAQTFALIDNTPLLGLAGNPAAAICGLEMLVYPALQKMQGKAELFHPRQWAKLGCEINKKDPRWNLQRASLSRNDAGELIAVPHKNQSSALFGVFQQSDCLVLIPHNVNHLDEGADVEVVHFDLGPQSII